MDEHGFVSFDGIAQKRQVAVAVHMLQIEEAATGSSSTIDLTSENHENFVGARSNIPLLPIGPFDR